MHKSTFFFRLEKKCQQLENLASAVIGMAKPGDVIVDFCSGGGHLAILLAYLLPSVCEIIGFARKINGRFTSHFF